MKKEIFYKNYLFNDTGARALVKSEGYKRIYFNDAGEKIIVFYEKNGHQYNITEESTGYSIPATGATIKEAEANLLKIIDAVFSQFKTDFFKNAQKDHARMLRAGIFRDLTGYIKI